MRSPFTRALRGINSPFSVNAPGISAAVLSSAIVADDEKSQVTVQFNKAVTSIDYAVGVTIEIDSIAVTNLASVTISPSATIVFTFDEIVAYGDNVTFSYDSSTGDYANDSLDVEDITDRAVTNNVVLPAPVFSGSVSNLNLTENTAMTPVDFSAEFTGVVDSYSISDRPAGLEFNASTGVLSGTPTDPDDDVTGVEVSAENASGTATSAAFNITIAAYDPPIWGHNPYYNGRTTGDWYVDGSVDSSGDGTSLAQAFKTVQEAVDASSDYDDVIIKEGVYPAYVSSDGKTGIKFYRYGTDVVVLTAFDPLEGLTACVEADGDVVGDDWSECYKVVIASAAFPANIPAEVMTIFEGEERLPVVYDRASDGHDRTITEDKNTFHTADSFNLEGGTGYIESITDAGVLANYTEGQLTDGAYIKYHGTLNNNVVLSYIDSFASNTATLSTVDTVPYNTSKAWALYNAGNLTPGTWMYRESGGDRTIYVYPEDSDNVTSNMKISMRTHVWDLGYSEALEFRGIKFSGGASNALHEGCCIGHVTSANSGDIRDGYVFENCVFGENSSEGTNRGCVYLVRDDNTVFKNNTINQAHSFGVYMADCEANQVMYNYFYRVRSASIRESGASSANPTTLVQVAFNKSKLCSWGAHANQANFYQGMRDCCFYGNVFEECGGYFTWQRANDLYIGMNVFCTSEEDGRSVVDQNDTNTVPTGNDEIVLWGNTSLPSKDIPTTGYAWDLGDTTQPPVFTLYNNLVNGVSRKSGSPTFGEEKNNLIFKGVANFTIDPSSELVDYDEVLTDVSVDYSFIDGSRAGKRSYDVGTLLTGLSSVFPDIDFTKDAYQDTISERFIGAYYPGFIDDDITAPGISALLPADEAEDVAINSDIVITYSERVKFGTGTITLYNTTGEATIETFDVTTDVGSGAGTISIDDNQLTIRTTNDLANAVAVNPRVPSGCIKDMNDNNAEALGEDDYIFGTVIASSYNTVVFPGSAWLERDAALTGASDGKEMTLYICYAPSEDSENHRLLNTSPNYEIYSSRTNTNKIEVGVNGVVSMLNPSATATVANGRMNILASIDSANGYAVLTIDGVTVVDKSPTADALIPFSSITDLSIMALVGGGNSVVGKISAFYLSDVHVDVESGAVQDTFFDAVTGDPVLSGVATPLVQFSGGASAWTAGTNEGSAGDFVKKGAGTISDV